MGPSPAVLGSLPGLLLLLLGPRPSSSDGNVGCLFSPSLCAPNIEWCYNDDAFGRCLQENVDEEDLYRHDLSPDELQEIEREMERLLSRGYRWSHSYTQCLLQSMLYTYKINAVNEPDLCDHLKDQDLSTALKAFESDEMSMDPQNMAYVKFTPSDNGPNAEFADEVYFPPVPLDSDVTPVRAQFDDTYEDDEVDVPQAFEDDSDYPSIGFSQKQFPFSLVRKKSLPEQQSVHFSTKYNTIDDFRRGFELKDVLPDLINEGFYYPDGFSVAKEMGIEGAPNKMEQTQQLVIPVEDSGDVDSSNSILLPMLRAIGESYPSPRAEPRMAPESARELLAELSNRGRQAEGEMARGYTEGGLVLIPDKHADADQSLRDFLDISWGFKRPERLDVKKPGPPFKTNNYAFKAPDEERSHKNKTENNMKETILSNGKQLDVNSKSSYQLFGNDLPIPLKAIMAEQLGVEVPPQKKAVGPNEIDMAGSEQYDIVNNNFAFINFKETIGTWQQGKHIIEKVAELLHLDKAAFDEIRIDRNEVTFRVRPNHRGLTAIKVAELIGNMKTTSKKRLGVTIISAGIGDKTKVVPEVLSVGGGVGGEREHELVVVAVVVSVVLVAVALSATLLLLVRRYSAGRAKIRDLAAPDTEASNDYQELCRARMAAKPPHDAAAASVPNRVASLSRESDNSPSSRSSTSSWSEEPALTTMDISTGHMVLSYMEDHLRNKDRLETEWAALCAYEAEPCSTTIATRPENAKKNRYAHALPYDHARVVLNELSNISGSDYINASTITDHDPRNPAYIATQGALPHTAADLWQMVWEQGCVVMVMLTRLADNDTALCHRYWPEEGSELYHIYEVHLVSEHFWCDDYLVRSFYLKNLKTTETRTVTQFHFLSWPDGGVPASTKALLEFRRKVNKSFRGRSCPIVVHCSDGVGRTGTYCLLDMVLNRMAKGAKEIDIAATLEHIRDQRGGSVATRQQFQFVLSAVAEEVQAILRVLPPATAQLKPSAVAAAVAATDTVVAATDTAAPQ